jgi:hypothetical protein
MSSRIDVPRARQSVAAGTVMLAGTAWSQHTGISRVQVQIDDQEWAEATLADAISIDTWRQWAYSWQATAGTHTVRVRATDANGLVQTADRAAVVPDGATGLHEISFTVG